MKKQPPQTTAMIYREIEPRRNDGRPHFIVIPLHELKAFDKSELGQKYELHGHTNACYDLERLLNDNNGETIRQGLIDMNELPF